MITETRAAKPFRESPDFSLVLGGPLFQLLRRASLTDDALQLLHRRIVVISLVAWLPLLVLAALQGQLLSGAAVPFLLDLEVHVKFLVVLPLLIWAELVVHRRMRFVAQQFLDRGLIPDNARARFDGIVASAFRLRNSLPGELLLIAIVYGVGVLIVWRHFTALDADTWYALSSAGDAKPSLAGAWYLYVSLPIFQFLMVRWYFRIFIWARFLWQVSRIQLSVVPTHPDRAGGLAFLSGTVYAFLPLATAHGVLLAGQIGNRIFHLGATLPDFRYEVLLLIVFLICLVLGPMLVFGYQLWQAKLTGSREYGILAQRYAREFDTKWLRGGAPPDEPLIGSADIQSLADLGTSIEVIREMRVTPFSKGAIIELAFATLAPIVPLALTMMPLEELLKKLFGILF